MKDKIVVNIPSDNRKKEDFCPLLQVDANVLKIMIGELQSFGEHESQDYKDMAAQITRWLNGEEETSDLMLRLHRARYQSMIDNPKDDRITEDGAWNAEHQSYDGAE